MTEVANGDDMAGLLARSAELAKKFGMDPDPGALVPLAGTEIPSGATDDSPLPSVVDRCSGVGGKIVSLGGASATDAVDVDATGACVAVS